ncbi:MAG: hypothetical protein DI606_18195 [Sphingobium sp.]|uniref:hypothetical protein n=1 Tax=Sphingobium sp. TaxID=1912891 RepID=UPI000DB2076A|nr:hypothetical protein [Sphingobium sp.]PZU06368.1 MAG: hypothetical protein DI606_18195 [Sphingobium sp.]PZU77964.1 MAG: hypothetical protein DI546_04820 [Rhizobium sp.]
MSRANPFSDLDDFASDGAAKPVPVAAIDAIAENAGFPSRKAGKGATSETATWTAETRVSSPPPPSGPARAPRRHTTGRNRQINIKATEETIEELYRIADKMGVPLGAVLERALTALAEDIE